MRCIETSVDLDISIHLNSINYNMRCIETVAYLAPVFSDGDKLQHEMYWNNGMVSSLIRFSFDKLQHEMYWNNI